MDLISNAYLAAFILGAIHAVEVDHMIAVSVFAGMKPRMLAAANYGARWGIGHALVVVLVGGIIALLNIKVPDNVVAYGEVLVGIALVALGIWALRRSKKFHTHPPREHAHSTQIPHGHLHAHNGQHGHSHSHQHKPADKHHQHLPTALGALHGLAGSAPVLALIPVTLLASFEQVVIYLLLFSVGTTLAMSVYALLAAAAVQGLGLSKHHVYRLTQGIAVATIVIGLWWMISSLL
jgi:ABC-type nickel/cobalt efflux system permease component RcnA